MKSIALFSRFFVSLSLVFSTPAWSFHDNDENQSRIQNEEFRPTAIRRFLEIYKKSRNFDDLLAQTEGKISPSDIAYLRKLTQEFKGQNVLPKIEAVGGGVLVFELNGLRVPVEVVSLEKRIFKINQRTINFEELKDVSEHFEAIKAALPKRQAMQSSPIFRLMVPEAQAILPLVGLAVSGVVTVVGAGIAAYELYTTNSYYCNEILEAAKGCKPPLRKMNERAESFNKVIDEAKLKKKKIPNCPKYADHEEKEAANEVQDEATAALDALEAKSNAKYAKVIKCDIEWDKANECKESLDKLARKLCMDIHKSLSDYSKAANSNAKTGGQ